MDQASSSSRISEASRLRSSRIIGAFTLIEILVVVAIIALLIAVLLPSLSRARFQTKIVVCKANLHDIGTGFFQYAESYKGYFPITPNGIQDTYFALYKARLLKNVQTLICPSTKNVIRPETLKWPVLYNWPDPEKPSPANTPHMELTGKGVSDIEQAARQGRDDASGGHSYEYNGCYQDVGKNVTDLSGKHKRATDFRFVLSQIFLINDSDDDYGRGNLGCEDAIFGGNNCPQTWDNHGAEGTNMLFSDSHAEWVKKVAGSWVDRTAGSMVTRKSKNATIDQIWARSEHPWYYFRR